jgi:tryptophanyl-tRNA synthetase
LLSGLERSLYHRYYIPPSHSRLHFIRFKASTKRILSLRDPSEKMSKSSPHVNSRILLTDTSSDIMLKIRKATTDSDFSITYDPINRPGISNLLRILHACRAPMRPYGAALEESEASARLDDELHALASTFQSQGATMASFKEAVADAVSARLAPIREEFARLGADEGYVRQVAREGANKARDIASRTVREVKERVGLGQL